MTRRAAVLCAFAGVGLWAVEARADGAFPDSFALFAPADQPSRLLLATNFGVLETQDAAATWWIICEQAMQSPNGFLYQVGAAPDHRIYGVSTAGLSVSPDEGCTWGLSAVGAGSPQILDVFPDPTDAAHVLAVARNQGGPSVLYESRNGGDVFPDPPLLVAPPTAAITGVEVSRSQPNRYYAALLYSSSGPAPFLARSDNRGATWQLFDLSPAFGAAWVGIAAVDPEDAERVYLRVTPADGGAEGLGIVTDGGMAAGWALSLSPGGRMTAFLRRADRSLWVAQGPQVPPGPPFGAFASTNGGASWAPALSNLHLRGLAERAGSLYVVADDYADGFAVGVSSDGGAPMPLLAYPGICGVAPTPALQSSCATWWQTQAVALGATDAGCPTRPFACGGRGGADAGSPPTDAGATDAGTPRAGSDAGAQGADAGADKGPRPKGCGCQDASSSQALAGTAIGLVLIWLRRRSRG